MDILNFTSTELSQNILELLGDTEYSLNAKKVSQMLKKRPFAPPKEAGFWIDHILEFGTKHLEHSAININSKIGSFLMFASLITYILILGLIFLFFKLLFQLLGLFNALFH